MTFILVTMLRPFLAEIEKYKYRIRIAPGNYNEPRKIEAALKDCYLRRCIGTSGYFNE